LSIFHCFKNSTRAVFLNSSGKTDLVLTKKSELPASTRRSVNRESIHDKAGVRRRNCHVIPSTNP
jgi:hypothetical protein